MRSETARSVEAFIGPCSDYACCWLVAGMLLMEITARATDPKSICAATTGEVCGRPGDRPGGRPGWVTGPVAGPVAGQDSCADGQPAAGGHQETGLQRGHPDLAIWNPHEARKAPSELTAALPTTHLPAQVGPEQVTTLMGSKGQQDRAWLPAPSEVANAFESVTRLPTDLAHQARRDRL